MPSTRAKSKSRAPARAGAVTETAVERAGPVEDSTVSADSQVDSEGNRESMSDLPKKLDDSSIILLRAKVTKSRKDVDDTKGNAIDQAGIVGAAIERAAPQSVILKYKQYLKEIIEDGDRKLHIYLEANGELVQKLEALILLLTSEKSSDLATTTSLRDKLVGEAAPYRHLFKKMLVEYEGLLEGTWDGEVAGPSGTAALPPRMRKEYDFFKPSTLHKDCTKRELMKFATDGKNWTSKTVSEAEAKEKGFILGLVRTVLDAGWAKFLDKHPNVENLTFQQIVNLMMEEFLVKNPLVGQRIKAMRIRKDKEETISEVLHRIHEAYISAEMDKCPVETLVLLHLLTLLASDPMSEKIKSWMVESMRVEPNIKSLDKVTAYIQQQESDFIASQGASQSTKVNQVKPQEDDPPKITKKEIKCKICDKKHLKFKCSYRCDHCSRKGHRSESCWTKFPEKNPAYTGGRAPTPAPGQLPKPSLKKKRSSSANSDRGSDFSGQSGHESDTTPDNRDRGRRLRRKSNRIYKFLPEADPTKGAAPSSSGSSSSWGHPSTKPPIRLFRVKKQQKEEILSDDRIDGKKEADESLEGIFELFAGLKYGKQSEFEKKIKDVKKVFRVQNGNGSPNMKGRILGSSTNKFINFVADTGSPVAFISRAVAIRNKLKILPVDDDEETYAGASGTPLTVLGQCQMFINFRQHKTIKELRALVIAEDGGEVLVGLDTLIDWGIIPSCFPLPMSPADRVGASREQPSFVRAVREHKPEKLVNINERVGSWRSDIRFNQVSEEQFEADHEVAVYAHLRNKLLNMFPEVFKEDLTPEDRLDIEPVKITLKPGHEDAQMYNARIPIQTPRYLEKAADRELKRIMKSGALEPVTWPTRAACRAFFVQKPGSPRDDPKVRLVNNFKPNNIHFESPGYPMDTSAKINNRLNPEDVCYGVVDLVQAFHQVPVAEECRDLLTVILPQGKYRFTCLPQGLVCSTDFLNIHTDPAIRGEEGLFKNVDDILCSAKDIKQLEARMKKLLNICKEKNMKIAPSKFQLGSSVVFGGTVIESQNHVGGKTVYLSPTQEKLDAFLDFPTPSCKKDVQSIMGAVAQLKRWVPGIMLLSSGMQKLTGNNTPFFWN